MKKKYSVQGLAALLLPVRFSTKKSHKVEMADGSGEITFDADDATAALIMEQLFPLNDKEVVARS